MVGAVSLHVGGQLRLMRRIVQAASAGLSQRAL
jgi:hypothetical protein